MGAWVDHDLSAFRGDGDLYGGSNHVRWDGTYLSRISGAFWRFALPDLILGPTDVTELEITYGTSGQDPLTGFNITSVVALDALSGATFDDFSSLANTDTRGYGAAVTTDNQTYTMTVGPGVWVPDDDAGDQAHFDTYVATAARPYVMFRSPAASGRTTIARIRTRVTNDAAPLLPAASRVTRAAPLRQYPRNDGLGTSSARRIWPPPRSQQASNRRGGGYL